MRSHPYGESDRIVTFITEDFGKVSGIAKGAMRSRRRFVNTLEPFVKVRLAFRARPRSDLVFIERCDLLEMLRGFGGDLERFACGSYILELTDRMVLGREPGAEIFQLVETTLLALDAGGSSPAVVRAFELHILGAIGYRPELLRCRGCDCPTTALQLAMIVPTRGSVFCPRCRPLTEPAHAVPGHTLSMLGELQRNPVSAAASLTAEWDAPGAETALEGLISHVITRPLRSRAVLSALRQTTPAW